MDVKLEAILLRFPDYSERIMKQVKENEEFESLCFDYELCIDMLKTLEKERESRHASLEEYLEIKIELEQEVLKYLD